jgi:Na+-transporting methylmalonyl-CoA/oxaloacetate decarboxylase gamma subunit
MGTSGRERFQGPPEPPEEEVHTVAIGFGIFLIVVGAALVWAVEIDIQFIDDNALGWILMVAGVAAILLSLVINAQRSRSTTRIEERRVDNGIDDRPPM